MKTISGTHQKWIVKPEHREQLRALFVSGFEATLRTPREDIDMFELADGAQIGVFFRADALDEAQARMGAWLEFAAEDPAALTKTLEGLAVARVPNDDTRHAYFQAPGGPVFRIAGRG